MSCRRVWPYTPKFLTRVLSAIRFLSNEKGSTARDIIDYMRKLHPGARRLVLNVRIALRYAVQKGLLVHSAGKFKSLSGARPKRKATVQCAKMKYLKRRPHRRQ